MSLYWGRDEKDRPSLEQALEDLALLFVERGRLQAISTFFERSIEVSNLESMSYSLSFECAGRLFKYVRRHYLRATPSISWSNSARTNARLKDGNFKREDVRPLIVDIDNKITNLISLMSISLSTTMDGRILALLSSIDALAGIETKAQSFSYPKLDFAPARSPVRTLRAPATAELDPIFQPIGSLTSGSFIGAKSPSEKASIAERCWLTAMHESLASRLCIITLFEYDNLPFEFYDDLAKQAADEANHAVRFLYGAKELIDELTETDEFWATLAAGLVESGTGLPVPIECDFYPSIRSADLRTRLTWMQIDTEGPGVGSLLTLTQDPVILQRPSIHRSLDFVVADEITHARFGRIWAKKLEGEHSLMEIDDARLLRGLLLSETVAVSQGRTLFDLVKQTCSET